MQRCPWCLSHPLYIEYHDTEWGVPVHDEQKMFEFLILEGFQAGLSWLTILKKREAFRIAFDQFDYHKIATYKQEKIDALLQNEGIVRNKLKIQASITNARQYLKVQEQYGSFCDYFWSFTNGQTVQNHYNELKDIPARTELSDKISTDLKKKGFKFVGSTIVYAHMQATGMVNDHLVSCFRHNKVLP